MVRGRVSVRCRCAPIAIAIGVGLASVCGCASHAESAAPARASSAAPISAGHSVASAPPGSAAAILPPSSAGPFILESGELLITGSDVPPAYEVHVTVTITRQPDEVSSANIRPASEYEVALVRISGQAGSFHYTDLDFQYLSADGVVYLPTAETGTQRFGKALASGTVSAGQSVQGFVVFHVPTGGGQVRFYDGTNGPPAAWRTVT